MKTAKLISVSLLVILLVSVPAAANAHWGFGGGAILGLGLGLLTGLALAPIAVHAGPVYYVPPPPAVYRPYSYSVPAPLPPGPPPYGYSNNPNVSSAYPPPTGPLRCRAWRLINRHQENRWDPYYGRWRTVLVERWGWVGVPCNN